MALVQVGIMARRSPSGDFLPAVPIYRDSEEIANKNSEYIPFDELAEIFAQKIKLHKAAEERLKKTEVTQ